MISRECHYFSIHNTMIIPPTRSVKFEDRLRLYRKIEQLLRRDLAFVTCKNVILSSVNQGIADNGLL